MVATTELTHWGRRTRFDERDCVPGIQEPSKAEYKKIRRLAEDLALVSFRTDPDDYVELAQKLWHRMPERYQEAVSHFRWEGSSTGGMLLKGLPTGPVPPTPPLSSVAVDQVPVGAAVLSLVAAGLGEQYGYRQELSGLMVQALVPEQGAERTQRSVSCLDPLYPHNEMVFLPEHLRSDFVGLGCMRHDHGRVAATTLAPVGAMLERLDAWVISVLAENRFVTTVDESFLLGASVEGPHYVEGVTVLSELRGRPRLRVDFAETTGCDPEAQAALDQLLGVASQVETRVRLRAGDILFVENHHALHGRTGFAARWDGWDRWLVRTFVKRDLSLSSSARPNAGRVIEFDFSTAKG